MKCECCCDPIINHVVHADGSVFCSQGCARAAGAIEAEELGLEPRPPAQRQSDGPEKGNGT